MHRLRNARDAVEITEDTAITVDVGLEDFPIIDARLARCTGIGQYETAVDLFGSNSDDLSMDAIGVEMNGAHAAEQCRIVILASGGHVDYLGFDVLGDHANLFMLQIPASEAGEGGCGGNHERRRSGNAGACRRFGM